MIRKLAIIIIFPLILSGCVGGFLKTSDKGAESKQLEFVKGQIVKGFPPLPQYPKSIVAESFGYKGKFGASLISGDRLDEVVNVYGQGLTLLNWEMKLKKKSETSYIYEIRNTKYEGTVIINTAADTKKTAISIAVVTR